MRRSLLAALLLVGCGAPTATDLGIHQPERVLGAIDRGPVAREQIIDLVVGLKLRDAAGLHVLLRSLERGLERTVAPADFAARFAATGDDYAHVVAWAQAHGLEVVRTVPGRTTVTLRGRAADVEAAFGTRLERWDDANGTFFAPTRAFFPAGDVADLLAGVVGLDDANRWFSHLAGPPQPVEPNASNGTQAPADLRNRYQFDLITQKGEGETVGILGTGYAPGPNTDVKNFSTKYGLNLNIPAQMTQVFLGGPNRDPDALATNELGENLLDIDMVFGLAPAASVIHAFTATNSPGLFTDGITFFVNQAPHAHAVSVSYGTCERVAIGEVDVMNALFAQAKAEGQAWFFASGDNGTDACRDGKPNKVISVNWPSSSPYVFSVGGTKIQTGNEVAWGGAGGGGGGQSEIIAKPAYQTGIGPYPDDGVRDQPDISALAGSPGVAVVQGNQTFAMQGTSAAAPMWAAAWAILDQAKGGGGIYASHERMYQMGKAGTPGFRDITVGNISDGVTPGYPALAGYDLATGWGVPNMQTLIANW